MLSRKLMLMPKKEPVQTSVSYIGVQSVDNASGSTQTFTGVNIGAADANRYVVVVAHLFANLSGQEVTGVSVNGNAASLVTEARNPSTTSYTGIWIIKETAGSTATVELTLSSASVDTRGIAIYRLISSSGTTVGTYSNPNTISGQTISLNKTSDSVIISGAGSINNVAIAYSSGSISPDPTYKTDMRSNEYIIGAKFQNSGVSGNVTFGISGTVRSAVAAAIE